MTLREFFLRRFFLKISKCKNSRLFLIDLFGIFFICMFKLITRQSLLKGFVHGAIDVSDWGDCFEKWVSVFFKHSDPILPGIPLEQSKIDSRNKLLNGN